MVDRHADRALSRQIADLLRDRIESGQLRHGQVLPAEQRIADEHGTDRGTARAALGILRRLGLVVTRAPYGSRVRHVERQTVTVPRGSRWYSRPATPREAADLEMPEELWVAVLVDPAGRETVYPVDAVEFSAR